MAKNLADWDNLLMKVSVIHAILKWVPVFLFVYLFLAAGIFLVSISLIPSVISLLFLGIGLLCFLLMLYLVYRTQSKKIVVKPCKVQSIADRPDVIPGKIITDVGTITKHIEMISLERFDECTVDKGIFGGIFDYGYINLHEGTEPTFKISGIISPESYIEQIQDTIDRTKGNVVRLQKEQEIQ